MLAGFFIFIPIFQPSTPASEPLLPFEDHDRTGSYGEHDGEMDPEGVRIVPERDGRAHREHVRIYGHREKDGGKDREDFHGHIELIREKRIVCRLKRLDSFLVALENIPDADVRADKILEIDGEIPRYERMILLRKGIDDGTLRLERPSEVQDIALYDGYLPNHPGLVSGEDLRLDIVEIRGDMVQLRETGIEKQFEDLIEEMRRRPVEMKPPPSFTL